MPTDESCSGFVNWETFTVGTTLQNVESMYRRALQLVRGLSTLEEAADVIRHEWGGYEFADRAIWDVTKVDWEDVADVFFDEEEEETP